MEWEQTGPVDLEVRAYVYSLVSAVKEPALPILFKEAPNL